MQCASIDSLAGWAGGPAPSLGQDARISSRTVIITIVRRTQQIPHQLYDGPKHTALSREWRAGPLSFRWDAVTQVTLETCIRTVAVTERHPQLSTSWRHRLPETNARLYRNASGLSRWHDLCCLFHLCDSQNEGRKACQTTDAAPQPVLRCRTAYWKQPETAGNFFKRRCNYGRPRSPHPHQ